MEAGLQSPILQVDGEGENSDEVYFTFKSEYGEEDVIYSLGEMFPPDVVTSTTLVSRVRLGKLWETADHQCTVSLKLASSRKKNFCWPAMSSQDDTFREVKKIRK